MTRWLMRLGGASLALHATWWCAIQATAGASGARVAQVPAVVVHALAMTLSSYTMCFAGFLFGRGRGWVGAPALPGRVLAPTLIAGVAARALWAWAVAVGSSGAWMASLLADAVAWTWAMGVYGVLVARRRGDDPWHPRLLWLAGLAGVAALWAAAWASTRADWPADLGIARFALWAFVGGTALTAAHRMVPFVSGLPWPRIEARLPALAGLLVAGVAVLQAVDVVVPALHPLVRGADLLLALVLGGAVVAWLRTGRWRPRMIRMLFAAFAWLACSLALLAASARGDTGASVLALHAFGAGFLGTVALAMVGRVLAGEAGRTDAADGVLWTLFLLLQAGVALRVAGPLCTGRPGAVVMVGAAGLWAAAWLLWTARYSFLARFTRERILHV